MLGFDFYKRGECFPKILKCNLIFKEFKDDLLTTSSNNILIKYGDKNTRTAGSIQISAAAHIQLAQKCNAISVCND